MGDIEYLNTHDKKKRKVHTMNFEYVDIDSMNGDFTKFAYYLDFVKMTSKSIYAKSPVYDWVYKIELKTGKIFRDGKQIAEISTYACY